MRRLLLILVAAATVATTGLALEARTPSTADAHPGRTDSAGCHTCRTNCASWGLRTGQYHCHNAPAPTRPAATATPRPAPVPTSTPRPTATTTPRATATPAPGVGVFTDANSRSVSSRTAVITTPDRSGVDARWACRTTARTRGVRLSEGSTVLVSRAGTGPCAAWSIVQSGRTLSWVRTEYLR